ncbi:HopJ type III effector protein [Paraglaciecola aquimarina]|uniref:HopJ type III effector protein n=1 Tax=Paraglaciecola aquimarina TaxID=1235557 RepID=A0ABU3SVR4_9ALTE|nr:HopJ type III effector protein [Paraglaciecola aquimarina]MDU0354077.1 HopJ type III effector protein [Paraglaciecola aquimarina]
MLINELITLTRTAPESIEFTQVMELITDHYHYTPTAFSNGDLASEAGSNEGSCKIFYFAKLNQLSAEQTLSLFGAYYREDVLQHPEGTDHGNIRNFMVTGWDGIEFFSEALAPK